MFQLARFADPDDRYVSISECPELAGFLDGALDRVVWLALDRLHAGICRSTGVDGGIDRWSV
jgi:hypothetical protein